ncbi:MAG: nucleotidyltransferase family protein [Clostridia bacterium]|nr:nucleotidyltransferase family protein [Clostridia bacterium]
MKNQEIIANIRTLVQNGTVTADISALLLRHGCFGLLSKLPDSPYKQQIALSRGLNGIAVRERYKACAPLFAQSEIPYAVIKGAVLSQRLYKDPFLRSSGDIDILIHRRDTDRLKELLLANGFVQGRVTKHGIEPFSRREIVFQATMSHQTAPYVKKTGNKLCPYINLDVNTDILWGESGVHTDMDAVLSCAIPGQVLDTSIQVLRPEMEFLALCLHHYKDLNSLFLLSQGRYRLGLFCELYEYLCMVRPDAQRLQELCRALGVGQYLYVCVFQVREIFADEKLDEYLSVLSPFRNEEILETFGLADSERHVWEIPLFERLFHPDLPAYVQSKLSPAEREKVAINRELM